MADYTGGKPYLHKAFARASAYELLLNRGFYE
jgi:hypothetical protein